MPNVSSSLQGCLMARAVPQQLGPCEEWLMSLLGVERVWGGLGFGWLFVEVENASPSVFTMPGRAGRQSYGTGRGRTWRTHSAFLQWIKSLVFRLACRLWEKQEANPGVFAQGTGWGCSDSKPRVQLCTTSSLNLTKPEPSTCFSGRWWKGDLFLLYIWWGLSSTNPMSNSCFHHHEQLAVLH